MPKRLTRRFLAQLTSSYAVQGLRVLNWAIAAGLVYRYDGERAFAVFAMARALVSVMNYMSIGIAPALVTLLPQMRAIRTEPVEAAPDKALSYAQPTRPDPPPDVMMWRTGITLSWIPFAILVMLLIASGFLIAFGKQGFDVRFWEEVYGVAFGFALGIFFRIVGDTAGARLQVEKRIATDNVLTLISEATWIPLAWLFITLRQPPGVTRISDIVGFVVIAFVCSCLLNAVLRYFVARRNDWVYRSVRFNAKYAGLLLATGAVMVLAQLADFLYAPANQLLIKACLSTSDLAAYAPTLFIDGALLLMVSGLSMVLFPYAANAFHERKWADLRTYYLAGTLVSLLILAIGAIVVCLIDGWLFAKWFGDPLSDTQAILPWVMIHTAIGGSASIGRSVLLGMGRIKAYAISTIVGGLANVAIGVVLLMTTDLGLLAIIFATILTVTIRCLIWMPIYTLWVIRRGASLDRRA